ncbi:MAG: peptide ABC transporter substrate-binding protein [Planctomycetota bacterium]|nr:peptide ABC transporter substrate-binding protein [Planctomycetota bacterium]
MGRQVVSLALLLGLLGLGLAVVGSARREPADITFNNFAEVSTLDPATVTGVPEGRVLYAIFEGLCIKHPQTLEPLPGMAESWEVSADGLSYVFHLRAEARWTNGDAVTAHDFVWAWERFLNPNTGAQYAYQLWYVKGARAYTTEVDDDGQPLHSFEAVGIRAADDLTLVVELEAPTPFFLDIVTFYPLMPVNRRNIEEAQARWPHNWEVAWLRPENLVTNGPFRVVERRINDRMRLEKFEGYWDADNVAFDSIDVTATEHYTTSLNLYLTGEIAWIDKIPNNLIPRLLPREDFNPKPYLGSYFFRVNVERPPFDDQRVRRALALTIDRKAICEKITKSGQVPSWTFVPPGLEGYEPVPMDHSPTGDAFADYDAAFARDCERAVELFAEAGYGPGGKPLPTIEIHYNTSETHRDVAEVIADGWKRLLGVNAKLLNQEWKVYLDTQSGIDYDVSRSAWIGDYRDANTFLDMFVTGGENNKTGWGNPRYDELIALAAKEVDQARRLAHLAAAEAILMDEVPILPIYYYVTQNIVNPRLGGFYENVQDDHLPKFWYWLSDEELAEKRAQQPPHWELVDAPGPAEGKYAPSGRRGLGGL